VRVQGAASHVHSESRTLTEPRFSVGDVVSFESRRGRDKWRPGIETIRGTVRVVYGDNGIGVLYEIRTLEGRTFGKYENEITLVESADEPVQ
jgi:ribosomal protein L35AE/L33A